ncbi:hypothetical protein H2198_002474 [Neophaeococcomyces mojaviensis]|uniref:Uncharacterized protein n=1 Tax=Neophaeococcomyces mojaviensis TaxID=3383035 RepID=A0ACC3AE78_9EURO|nr:hypothetical protein H2198_002474 [Knufia sp. JES_112]
MTSTASQAQSTIIPHIHLLCLQPTASEAFPKALAAHNLTSSISYTIHNNALSHLNSSITFDLVVSPANSFGILDGGFDDAISRAWSPKDDYTALMRALQADLYKNYRGFQPPGSCHLFKMPKEFKGKLRYNDGNGWDCRFIAHCPTMRVPSSCQWDREVVYECIWTLLCAIDKHNRSIQTAVEETSDPEIKKRVAEDLIRSILMTPLATATGMVSYKKWAEQTALAMKHFIDAVNNPADWSALNWPKAQRESWTVVKTHKY